MIWLYPPDDRVMMCLLPPGFETNGCQFPIYWYGVLIVLGMLGGAYLASLEAKRRGIDPDHIWGALTWALIFGLIGARLYHVLTPPASMGISVWDYLSFKDVYGAGIPTIIDIRRGGLGIYGAIIGGLLGAAIYCRRNKLNFWTAADMGAYAMPIGQAIGRWGNFFNQELYGTPTSGPVGLRIDAQFRLPPYNDLNRYPVDTTAFQPVFLYESLWSLLTFGVLVFAARRYARDMLKGELLALYAAMYAIGRILNETVRTDNPSFQIGSLTMSYATAVSIAILLIVAIVVYARRRAVANGRILTDSGPGVQQDQISMTDVEYAEEHGADVAEQDLDEEDEEDEEDFDEEDLEEDLDEEDLDEEDLDEEEEDAADSSADEQEIRRLRARKGGPSAP